MSKPKTTPTVRVKICVAVCRTGEWAAFGMSKNTDDEMREAVFTDDLPGGEIFHWVEADVPVPVGQTIEGKSHEA